MINSRLFKKMQTALNQYGYPTVRHQETPEGAPSHLLVTIPEDDKHRERSVVVRVYGEVFSVPFGEKNEAATQEFFMQMISVLPFNVNPESYLQVMRMVNAINLGLEFSCFLFDERNGQVICRYTFVKPSETISSQTWISLFGMFLLFLDAYSAILEEVSNGKSVEEVLISHVESRVKKAA